MKSDIVVDTREAWETVFQTDPEDVGTIYIIIRSGKTTRFSVNEENIHHMRKIKYIDVPPFPKNSYMLCAYMIGTLRPVISNEYVSLLPGMVQGMVRPPKELHVMTRSPHLWCAGMFDSIYERTFIVDPTAPVEESESSETETEESCESADSSSSEDDDSE